MVEKAEDPTQKKSQSPDTQKQTDSDLEGVREVDPAPREYLRDQFTKGTATPDKEG